MYHVIFQIHILDATLHFDISLNWPDNSFSRETMALRCIQFWRARFLVSFEKGESEDQLSQLSTLKSSFQLALDNF